MTGLAAAREGDSVSHTDSAFGFALGGEIGLAVGLALLTAATGGADLLVLAAVGGAVAATGGGALAGMNIGSTYGDVVGDVLTGSPNVRTNSRDAARTLADAAICDDHDGPQQIATGSGTVFINGAPAARLTDHTVCDARISSASGNVFIGGGTATYASVSGEVPQVAVDIARAMAIGGTAVALGAGGAAAYAAAGWAGVGVFGLQAGGGLAGGAGGAFLGGQIGGAIDPVHGAAWGQAVGGVAGGAGGGLAGGAAARGMGLEAGTAATNARPSYLRSDLDSGWFNNNGSPRWPPNDGFDGAPTTETLPPGTLVDRYTAPGPDRGSYLSPSGTPFEQRSLPYDPSNMSYRQYQVVQDLPVQSGNAAPWFDQPGGGEQYMTDRPIQELLNSGHLKQVGP